MPGLLIPPTPPPPPLAVETPPWIGWLPPPAPPGRLVFFVVLALEVGRLDLAVEVFEDCGKLLVGERFPRQLQDPLFPRAVDEADLAQLLLQVAQALRDLVVVVGVVVGLVVGGEEADVAEFGFEALVDLGVRVVLGVGGGTVL